MTTLQIIILCVFFIGLISAESSKNLYIALLSLIMITLTHYLGYYDFLFEYITIKNIIIYLLLGLIYCLLKVFFVGVFHNEKQFAPYISLNSEERKKYIKEREIEFLKENVMRWWLLFPISSLFFIYKIIPNFISDIIYSIFETGKSLR
jgi:hypothetical protein